MIYKMRITHLVSGLTEVQGLCVSAQKEFSKRQSDRQERVLLRWDMCERHKQAGEEALPQGLEGLQFYNPREVGSGKRLPSSFFE